MTTDDVEARERSRSKGGKLPPGVYWRYDTLWISYYVTKDGRREKHRERTDATSPREAGQLRAERMTEHARGERTVDTGKVTVADAIAAVLAEYEREERASLDTAKGRAKAIEVAFGPTMLAIEVADRIDAVHLRWKRAGDAPATINRRTNLLRRGLRLLVRKRRLPFVPFLPTLQERSEPARYITPAEADAIRAHLPEYLRLLFSLALSLGIRRGQLSRTLRRFVDLDRGVVAWPPAECKHREPHVVPLDDEARELVEAAMAAAVPWCPFLLHGPDCAPGRKASKKYGCVGDGRDAFRNAVEAAELPYGRKGGGIVFHCTRSTAATDLRAGGMEEADCMAVGGWKTRSVFARYNLGDTEALRERLAAARGRRGRVVPLRKRADG